MNDQEKSNDGNLVPTGRRDLVPTVSANPLVARGVKDLARMHDSQSLPHLPESPGSSNRPAEGEPFDPKLSKAYSSALQALRFAMRIKEANGFNPPPRQPGAPNPDTE